MAVMSNLKIWSKEQLAVTHPQIAIKSGMNLEQHMREIGRAPDPFRKGKNIVTWEFIGTDNFGTDWNNRQRFEIDAGRDEEPIVYTPLYQETRDASLPKNVTINRMGPAGVFFSATPEGSEVYFASIGASQQAVPMIDWTVGLEYSEQLVVYNQMWDVAPFERQAGIAHNALLNNIHIAPFLTYTYTAANQTAASAVGANLAEKILRTLEDAVVNSKTDTSNPRRGPYALLVSAANMFSVERALRGANLADVDMQSSARAMIRDIIVYDGWSGSMNNLPVTYSGVTANKAYLIDISPSSKAAYARSFIKFLLRRLDGSADVSRLMASQIVLWSSVGTYVSPAAIAEEVTLPTS